MIIKVYLYFFIIYVTLTGNQPLKRLFLINYISDKLLFDKLNNKVMEHKLNTLKADLYNVFVKGDANNLQITRVFVMLVIPAVIAFMIGIHIIK
jgi:hypothetical protein